MTDRLPGVTTIISQNLGWNKQALLSWANKLGLAGKSHRDVLQAAANAGTLCHRMIDDHIKGKLLDLSGYDHELVRQARAGFDNFLKWKERVGLQVRASEMYLRSMKHRCAGKIDCVGFVNSRLSIVDWKSAADPYPDTLIQLAVYGILWNENFPNEPLTGGYHLLCLGKEDAAFNHRHWDTLPGAFEAFLRLSELHELHGKLKGLLT